MFQDVYGVISLVSGCFSLLLFIVYFVFDYRYNFVLNANSFEKSFRRTGKYSRLFLSLSLFFLIVMIVLSYNVIFSVV